MAEPFEDGAVKATEAEPLPAVAVTPDGASGTVDGVTGDEAGDEALMPLLLVAVTVKV